MLNKPFAIRSYVPSKRFVYLFDETDKQSKLLKIYCRKFACCMSLIWPGLFMTRSVNHDCSSEKTPNGLCRFDGYLLSSPLPAWVWKCVPESFILSDLNNSNCGRKQNQFAVRKMMKIKLCELLMILVFYWTRILIVIGMQEIGRAHV